MGVAVYREAAVVALQNLQVFDDPVGQAGGELHELATNELPVSLGAVLHAQKVCFVLHRGVSVWM